MRGALGAAVLANAARGDRLRRLGATRFRDSRRMGTTRDQCQLPEVHLVPAELFDVREHLKNAGL